MTSAREAMDTLAGCVSRFCSCNDGRRARYLLSVGAFLLLLSWSLAFLAAYPGFYCYDTTHFLSYIESGALSSQQSVLHTLIIGEVLKLFLRFFGNWNYAIAGYTLVQMTIIFLALNLMQYQLLRHGASPLLVAAVYVWFAVNPFIAMFVVCSTKDVLFGLWVFLFLGTVLLLGCDPTARRTRYLVILGVLVFLASAYRNNAMYAFVIVGLLLLVFGRKREIMRIVGLASVMGCLLCALWSGPIASVLGVSRSNAVKEMISIPAANIAYLASRDNLPDLPPELMDLQADDMAFGWRLGRGNSDNYRTYLWHYIDAGQTASLFGYWVRCVLRDPMGALISAGQLTEVAWNPLAEATSYNFSGAPYLYDKSDTSTFACWTESPGVSHPKLSQVYDFFWSISRDANYGDRPLLMLFVAPAVFNWLTIGCFLFSAVNRRPVGIAVNGVLLAIIFTLLLGPTTLPRYYVFLIFSSPLAIAACVHVQTTDKFGISECQQ